MRNTCERTEHVADGSSLLTPAAGRRGVCTRTRNSLSSEQGSWARTGDAPREAGSPRRPRCLKVRQREAPEIPLLG